MANFKIHNGAAAQAIPSNSFQKGWRAVPQGQAEEVKQRIKDVLHVTTRQTFYNRLNGLIEHKPSEIAAIEGVFAEYGITEIWGE